MNSIYLVAVKDPFCKGNIPGSCFSSGMEREIDSFDQEDIFLYYWGDSPFYLRVSGKVFLISTFYALPYQEAEMAIVTLVRLKTYQSFLNASATPNEKHHSVVAWNVLLWTKHPMEKGF